MIAKNVRQRLSNIQQSYDGHMDLMIRELDELERLAEIGKAKEEGVEVIWDDEDMYCGNCDNYVYDDENYCKECGAKLLIHGRDMP